MRKSERGSTIASIAVIVALFLTGILGYVFWQNYLQPKLDVVPEQNQSSQEAPSQTVTSALEGWSISLKAPESWKVETSDTQIYNYDISAYEKGNQTKLTHPSGKVSVLVQHNPTSMADGTCEPSPIAYLNKETLADSRLVLIEGIAAVERGPYFLGITNAVGAVDINEGSGSCSLYPTISEVSRVGQKLTAVGEPYVSVTIVPSFVDYSESAPVWNEQTMLDFIKTEEYLEAKAIAKSLQL